MNVIVIKSIGLGFFSLFNHVIGTLEYMEYDESKLYYKFEPFVFFKDTVYSDGSINLWECFFENVSKYTLQDIFGSNDLAYIDKKIDDDYLLYVNNNEIHIAPYHNCNQGLGYSGKEVWAKERVKRLQLIIKKYIKLKPSTEEKINDFYYKNMINKNVVGVHFRATDKFVELPKIIPIDNFINEALKRNPDIIFLSTDCQKSADRALKLSNKVIMTDSFKSQTDNPIHYGSSPERCEEVIIDCYLLSKCNHIIHSLSNVPQAALYLNENLTNTYLI